MVEQFNDFLETTVNLNQSRYNRLNKGIEVVENFLKNHEDFKDIFASITPQGSAKHETLIKPVRDNDEFDVDILFLLERQRGWKAKKYLDTLHDAFANTKLYENKVDRAGKRRCVTLDYESEFHIDIVPCILDKHGKYKIMNKSTNKFELTDGEGYAKWFEEKNKITGNNLREVIKIAKYLRNYKKTFSAKSILLTTLLGMQVDTYDSQKRDYTDIPTSLKTLFNRLDEYLQANEKMPVISNPVLPNENFTRHWNDDKYSIFRDKIHDYTEKINAAFESKDKYESSRLWTELFGSDFELLQEEVENISKEIQNRKNNGAEVVVVVGLGLLVIAGLWIYNTFFNKPPDDKNKY